MAESIWDNLTKEQFLEIITRKKRKPKSSMPNGYVGLKAEMAKAYGSKCECCGEDGIEFLTIEHTNHDGKAHRSRVGGGGINVYLNLKKRGWPRDGFALFCMNCNWATRFGGKCPHQRKMCANLKTSPINELITSNAL